MSAPNFIDNLPSCAKNCQIWWKLDVVITKIILLVFLRHGVHRLHVRLVAGRWARPVNTYDTIRYDTIAEFNVDSKAEYTCTA